MSQSLAYIFGFFWIFFLDFWIFVRQVSQSLAQIFLDSSAGKYSRLKVKDPSGLTVEGLQEYYDEACLAILNNRWDLTEVQLF